MYTKLWLDYSKKVNVNITGNALESGSALVDNAVSELRNCKYMEGLSVELEISKNSEIKEEGYKVSFDSGKGKVEATTETGLIYGTFRFISLFRLNKGSKFENLENPASKLRMLNHWDNMDG
ncbi:MAG: hypothetical protein IKZ39_07765, partial [Lachnospiraceae bacterium]|nr:hypothetical protein [Lachnospiraceae bacterium]